MDTVVWQLLASVACPGYTIHTVVAAAHAALLPIEARPSRRGLSRCDPRPRAGGGQSGQGSVLTLSLMRQPAPTTPL
jgi:hypothetical protein